MRNSIVLPGYETGSRPLGTLEALLYALLVALVVAFILSGAPGAFLYLNF